MGLMQNFHPPDKRTCPSCNGEAYFLGRVAPNWDRAQYRCKNCKATLLFQRETIGWDDYGHSIEDWLLFATLNDEPNFTSGSYQYWASRVDCRTVLATAS